MKYAVIYQSKSGNTKRIAKEIYKVIESSEKYIVDIDETDAVPEADVYFVGFGVHSSNCGMDIIDVLEQTENAKCALFATCGYVPTDNYKEKLEKNIEVWIPDETEYMGMFLCQGAVEREQKNIMINKMPSGEERLRQMFEVGDSHPDGDDLDNAARFAAMIQEKAER